MTNPFQGLKITVENGTIFVPLPPSAQVPISGGCSCPYCNQHRDKQPMWDTIALHPNSEETWTVHHPRLQETLHLNVQSISEKKAVDNSSNLLNMLEELLSISQHFTDNMHKDERKRWKEISATVADMREGTTQGHPQE